jgi:hypothetical protein
MPYKDPDPSDPNVLVGVVLPAEKETMQDMAYAFAEEYALLGYDSEGLFRVFQNPFYAAAHQAYRALGEEAVRKIIAECMAAWGGIRFVFKDEVDQMKREKENSSFIPHPSSFKGRER